ncbi:CubicO group peptidase, beta-lactamase class C family [Terribacillus halophilus]|uniref:CubicO group peptidase, beta-lactamase class C family n=1 Tax=Terribacillus halophilus TaxID=361279 RepID=A0A1G6QP77_9BACI|nr:serine hydrolase domain-containing protein [Terribacillus halophilus]SDC94051.1 CubicO group peptidase, beta-lactamase class C family [Terribacillus halophilus]
MKLTCLGVILIVCFILYPYTVRAETSKELTDYLERYLEQEKIPGASISIVSKGETVYTYNWGVTGEDEQRVTSQTPFTIGSISKSFTGLAIAKLIDEGQLSLDHHISDFLPSLHLHGAENHITIRHLLTHTSGISSYDGLKISDIGNAEQIELKKIAQRLSGISLTQEPGSVHQYSAANYLILGAIIEEVTKQKFADYMQQHIFSPLGMTHTAADEDAANRTGYRSGYQSWFGYPVKSKVAYDNSGTPYSTITSSAEDMTQFILLLLGRHNEDVSASILNRYTEKLYERKSDVYYGFGLRHTKLHSGQDIIWHSGSTPDAHAELFYIPEEDWGAIILTNKNHIFEETSLPLLKQGIIDIMHDHKPGNIPSYYPTSQLILCLLLTALFLWTTFLIIKRRKIKRKKRLLIIGTLSVVLGGIIIPILIYLTQSPWRSISAFAPDIAFLTLSLAVLMVCSGIICFLTYFRKTTN